MPYRPHSEYPSRYTASANGARPRPSGAWFAVGGVLMLVAIMFLGTAVLRFMHTLGHSDARFQGSGVHQVTLPPDTQLAVFTQAKGRSFRCTAVDGSHQPVPFERPAGAEWYGAWSWVGTFPSRDGNLTFTCDGDATSGGVRIAPVPSGGVFLSLFFLGIVMPLILGGAGFVVMLVTGILWVSRPPSSTGPLLPGGTVGPAGLA